MIAVDTNVLVYAHRSGFPQHQKAHAALKLLAEGRTPWALPIFCIAEFLRVITHIKFAPAYTLVEARDAVERILASPSLQIMNPGDHFVALLLEEMASGDCMGNLVFDAQIVALCREHGVRRLLTEDRDFDRFSSVVPERLS